MFVYLDGNVLGQRGKKTSNVKGQRQHICVKTADAN